VPSLLSVSLASRLSGLSRAAFDRVYIQTGACALTQDECRGRQYIQTSQLAKALGRPITLRDYEAADASLATRRAYQRSYRRTNATIQ
jgi:hypothetical protein